MEVSTEEICRSHFSTLKKKNKTKTQLFPEMVLKSLTKIKIAFFHESYPEARDQGESAGAGPARAQILSSRCGRDVCRLHHYHLPITAYCHLAGGQRIKRMAGDKLNVGAPIFSF